MPRRKGDRQPKGKQERYGDLEEPNLLVPDPTWVDITPLPVDADHFNVFTPPRSFYENMVAGAPSWAPPGSELGTVRCLAAAISKIVMPWLADYQQWRRHVADHLSRLCSHRAYAAQSVESRFSDQASKDCHLDGLVSKLRDSVSMMRDDLAEAKRDLEVAKDDLYRVRRQVERLSDSFQPVQELALLRPSSVLTNDAERIRRAQHRATSSRSPDPRAATAAMRQVEQMDRRAIAMYEPASSSGAPAAVPSPYAAFAQGYPASYA